MVGELFCCVCYYICLVFLEKLVRIGILYFYGSPTRGLILILTAIYISLSDYLPYNGYVVVVAFFFPKSFSFNFFNSKKNVIARVKRKRILFIIEICAKKRRFVKRIEKRAFLRRKISHEKFGYYSIFSYLCKRDAKASIRTTALRCNCKVDTHELRKLIRSIILQGCPIEWIVPLSRPRNLGRERFSIYTQLGWTNWRFWRSGNAKAYECRWFGLVPPLSANLTI